jgi:hypothetical protein
VKEVGSERREKEEEEEEEKGEEKGRKRRKRERMPTRFEINFCFHTECCQKMGRSCFFFSTIDTGRIAGLL